MKHLLTTLLLVGLCMPAICAQERLSLDSCRALALKNNKQINAAKAKQEIAQNIRKAVHTKHLPRVDAAGGYQYFSETISLLSNDQKSALNQLGTSMSTAAGGNLSSLLAGLVQQGILPSGVAQQIGGALTQMTTPLAAVGNQVGQQIVKSFDTNTHHVWGGAVMVRQPIYMGGAITALNQMAKINERITANDTEAKTQATLYDVDQAYWLVVSLKQKQQLAESYLALVKKLSDDVQKMIREGVTTRAVGLKVAVSVNEAEMQRLQVDDGLALAKMLLCQLCGLPLDQPLSLVDEDVRDTNMDLDQQADEVADKAIADQRRPELRTLSDIIDMSRQATKLARATYIPHVMLTGGYLVSNPNILNGFERRFGGTWNVGILIHVPLWNWFEGAYRVRATKAATALAQLERSDAQEKINLQISQCQFKVKEAHKRLMMARKNITSAEENLRCANLGFKEGVIETTDVMAAQTAWQMAQSQKIDAEIAVKLAHVNLQKALGILNY